MKKKNWILPGLVAFIVVAGSLTVGFSSRASAVPKEKNTNTPSTCCKKKEECKENTGGSSEILLDNVSRQFMTIFAAGR